MVSFLKPRALGRAGYWLVPLAVLGILGGCAGNDPFTQKRMTQGAVRSSLARIEAERDDLRKEIAQLRSEQTRLEELLAEERARGDDLATRLDTARNLLEGRGTRLNAGLNPGMEQSNSIRASTPERVTPTRQPRRKVPFAQIPGQIEEVPDTTELRSRTASGSSDSARDSQDDIFDGMPIDAQRP